MSLYHGRLLFDIADPPIGMWYENLGGRGLIDIWEIREKGLTLYIQADETCPNHHDCECQEVWVGDENGVWESVAWCDSYEEAILTAKKWMQENPNGW